MQMWTHFPHFCHVFCLCCCFLSISVNVMRAILLDLCIHIYLYFCLDINQFKLFDYVLSTDSMVICKTHASRLSVEPAQELLRAFFQIRKFHAIPEADFFEILLPSGFEHFPEPVQGHFDLTTDRYHSIDINFFFFF